MAMHNLHLCFRILGAAIVVFLIFLRSIIAAHAETGTVVKRVSGCDYFLINTASGLTVAEWYGGYDPREGDRVAGSFNGYGFKTLFYGPRAIEGRVWIEDYSLDRDEALEKLSEQCS